MHMWGNCGGEKGEGSLGDGGDVYTKGDGERPREVAPTQVNKQLGVTQLYIPYLNNLELYWEKPQINSKDMT